ncbi:MAG: PASTA domain-containing protein [Firmicutes bacterium]|nr:PASTA domain-containing protein [Bacillota bacterium]
MKVLLHKLKKCNKILLSLFIITFILYTTSLVFIFKSILSLEGIETVLRIIFIVIFSLWLIIYLIWNLVNLILKRNKTIIITTILTIIISGGFIYASLIINKLYGSITNMAEAKYTVYTTNLISLNSTDTINKDDKLGMIKSKDDIEGNILAKELIKKEKLKNKIEYYDDYYSLLNALYNKDVSGVFVSDNYVILFSSEEKFKDIATDTHVLHEYSKKIENKNNKNKKIKSLTEPFSILLMGVDSEKDGLNANAAFNGDTLILITFNPKTLTATMFSMPRDIYVPIACNNNRYNKINSSAAYGTDCVVNTVSKLTDIKIDYHAKINFNGFIDLVDALGGVDVDVEQPDYDYYVKVHGKGKLCESNQYRESDEKNLVCMDTGMQHLNGKQALAYARNRHGFIQSDIARNRHQQQIVEAIAKKTSTIKSFEDFEKILDAITNNIATNMNKNQILSFYNVLKDMLANSKNNSEFVTIKKTYLETYSLPVYLQYAYMYTSALGYYSGSLDAIKDLMKTNLELKKKEIVKSFNYKYGENYEANATGKGITSGGKLELVPNFIGQSETSARNWASNNGINIEVVGSGPTIINQSVPASTLAKSISSITVELGGGQNQQPTNEISDDNQEEVVEQSNEVVETTTTTEIEDNLE